MKFTIDLVKKEITLLEPTNLVRLLEVLETAFPEFHKEFVINTKPAIGYSTIQNWPTTSSTSTIIGATGVYNPATLTYDSITNT